jgi:preprotein translocase subunit SecD
LNRATRHRPLLLAALMAVASIGAGCHQALACDVSVFSVGTAQLAPGEALPSDAELLLNAGDFDTSLATIGPTDSGIEVRLHLQPSATERFREFTAANIGESIAISLNGDVVSTPQIQAEIPDGALSLTLPPDQQVASDAFARCITRRALPSV